MGPCANLTSLAAPYCDPGRVVFKLWSFPVFIVGVAVRANRRSHTDTTPSCDATANIVEVQLKAVEKDESSDAVKVAWCSKAPEFEMSNRKTSEESPTQTMLVLSGETEQ